MTGSYESAFLLMLPYLIVRNISDAGSQAHTLVNQKKKKKCKKYLNKDHSEFDCCLVPFSCDPLLQLKSLPLLVKVYVYVYIYILLSSLLWLFLREPLKF